MTKKGVPVNKVAPVKTVSAPKKRMTSKPRQTTSTVSMSLDADDMKMLATELAEIMPAAQQQKSGFAQFVATFGTLALTVAIAAGGWIFNYATQGDKITNIDSNLAGMKASMVTTDLLNSKLSEISAKQDSSNRSLNDLNERVGRLELRAMNGKP